MIVVMLVEDGTELGYKINPEWQPKKWIFVDQREQDIEKAFAKALTANFGSQVKFMLDAKTTPGAEKSGVVVEPPDKTSIYLNSMQNKTKHLSVHIMHYVSPFAAKNRAVVVEDNDPLPAKTTVRAEPHRVTKEQVATAKAKVRK